jgi:hypothetical protein
VALGSLPKSWQKQAWMNVAGVCPRFTSTTLEAWQGPVHSGLRTKGELAAGSTAGSMAALSKSDFSKPVIEAPLGVAKLKELTV